MEVAQEFSEHFQESATANDRYLVSKTRMQMKRYCMNNETIWAELQQFDKWSFGRRLAYARNLQATKPTQPPGLELASGRQHQDGVQDPLQDQRKPPWTKGKTRPEQEDVKKTAGPQEYYMTPPPTPTRKLTRRSKESGPPSPSLELPEAALGSLGHITRPSKG